MKKDERKKFQIDAEKLLSKDLSKIKGGNQAAIRPGCSSCNKTNSCQTHT